MPIKRLNSNILAKPVFCCVSLFDGIASADMIAEGRKVAFDSKKGSRLACQIAWLAK